MSVVSGLATVTAPALSQAAPPAAQDNSPQARYRQAHEAFKSGKFQEAQTLLIALWKEKPSYDVAVTLVQVEYQLTHYASAARYLRFALANIPPNAKPGTANDFRQQLDELVARVGTVTVHVSADAADILVDDELLGTSPLREPLFVDAGTHRITARLAEHKTTESVTVVAGESHAVELKLPAGSASVQSGLPGQPVSAGNERAGSWCTTERTAAAGIGGGLTLLAASAAIAFRVEAGNKQDSVDKLRAQAQQEIGGPCPASSDIATCRQLSSTASDRNSASTVSRVSFVISGVLAAATVTTLFLLPSEKPATGASVAPLVGPGFAGLSVNGAF